MYTPITASVSPAAKGIYDFRITALRRHVGISELMTERNEKAASALKVRSRLSYSNVTDLYSFLVHAQTRFTLRTCSFLQHGVLVTFLLVDIPGYKVEFEFAKNEFFSNTIPSKVYYYEVSLVLAMSYIRLFTNFSSSALGRARLPWRLRIQECGGLRHLVDG